MHFFKLEHLQSEENESPTDFVFNQARGEAYCVPKQAPREENAAIASTSKEGSQSSVLKTKRPLPSFYNDLGETDHDYLPTPRKQIRRCNLTVHETDNIYKATVDILKNIQSTVDQGLAKINHTLDTHLSNIHLALLGKK